MAMSWLVYPSPIHGRLDICQRGASLHNTVMNASGQVSVWMCFHFSWREPVPQRANARVYDKCMFALIKNARPFPKAVVPAGIRTGSIWMRVPGAPRPSSSN